MGYDNADEFMAALNEKVEAYQKKHADFSKGYTEGLTWGMVTELIIERNQLLDELNGRDVNESDIARQRPGAEGRIAQ